MLRVNQIDWPEPVSNVRAPQFFQLMEIMMQGPILKLKQSTAYSCSSFRTMNLSLLSKKVETWIKKIPEDWIFSVYRYHNLLDLAFEYNRESSTDVHDGGDNTVFLGWISLNGFIQEKVRSSVTGLEFTEISFFDGVGWWGFFFFCLFTVCCWAESNKQMNGQRLRETKRNWNTLIHWLSQTESDFCFSVAFKSYARPQWMKQGWIYNSKALSSALSVLYSAPAGLRPLSALESPLLFSSFF